MTFTVANEHVFVVLSVATLIIQAWQVRRVDKLKEDSYKIKDEIEEIWSQIRILAMTTAAKLEKIEKLESKIDGKQDKQK